MPTECLECLIGAARVEVPLAEVERLLEYRAAPPPPLAHPWLAGIGVESAKGLGDLFLSVSLVAFASSGPRDTRGLLFRPMNGRPRWALEVDRVLGLQEVELEDGLESATGWTCPPGWLKRGIDTRGEVVYWLDLRAAARSLAGEGAAA